MSRRQRRRSRPGSGGPARSPRGGRPERRANLLLVVAVIVLLAFMLLGPVALISVAGH